MTAILSLGRASPVSGGGMGDLSVAVTRSRSRLSSGLPGVTGSISLVPPLRSPSKVVMSSFPLRFLASWQAKQFSLRIGATSLMKLTGFSSALAELGPSIARRARIPATMAQRTQKQRPGLNIRWGSENVQTRRDEQAHYNVDPHGWEWTDHCWRTSAWVRQENRHHVVGGTGHGHA